MAEGWWRALSLLTLGVAVLVFAAVEQYPTTYPNPDAPSYVGLSESLAAGDGYRIDLPGEPEGSRYPPGLPILLAFVSPVVDASTASVLLMAALAVAVWFAARNAGGHVAATVAVVVLVASRPMHHFAGTVMADIPGALLLVLALIAVQRDRPRLAGVLAGFAVWIKLAQVVVIAALPRKALVPCAVMGVGLIATKLAWGWGYRSGDASWALHHIWTTEHLVASPWAEYPNVITYPLMLLGLHRSIVLPGAIVAAGIAVWRRPERRFVVPLVVGLVAVYVPYFYQDLRFMLPIVAFVAIYSGAFASDLLGGRSKDGDEELGGVVEQRLGPVGLHARSEGDRPLIDVAALDGVAEASAE